MGYWEGIVPCEGGEALAQGAQRSCGCSWIPGSVQGQAEWASEPPGLVECVPAHGRAWHWMGFEVLFTPNQAVAL